jgi:hypothetical protein
MRKNKAIANTREWAKEIISFARLNPREDDTRPNLNNYQLEPDRIVATDGHRLAIQTYSKAEGYQPNDSCLVDDNFQPVAGEFPDYRFISFEGVDRSLTSYPPQEI